MNYTKHAICRSQQRSIPTFIIEQILDFGNYGRHKGADVYFLDKVSRKNLQKSIQISLYTQKREIH